MDDNNDTIPVIVVDRSGHNDLAVFIGALGITFNALSLIIFSRKPRLLSRASRIVINNQCLLDLLSGIFLIYSQYHSWYLGTRMPDSVPTPRIYCTLVWSTFPLWGALQASSWNLQFLTVERYISICRPILHKNVCTRNGLIIICASIWLAGYAFNGAFTLAFMRYYPETNLCLFKPLPIGSILFGTAFFLLSYIIPIILMLVCYSRVFYVLKSRISPSNQNPANDQGIAAGQQSREEKKHRLARSFSITCMIINLAYIICYSCNAFYFFLSNIGVIPFQPFSTFYLFSVIMVFTNCFINPIIFATKMAGFREEFFKWLRCVRVSDEASSVTYCSTNIAEISSGNRYLAPVENK